MSAQADRGDGQGRDLLRVTGAMSTAVGMLAVVCLLGGCGTSGSPGPTSGDGPPREARDVSAIADAVPQAEPRARYGNMKSYVVFGQRYYTRDTSSGFVERGIASWYGKKFHGRKTSSGEVYDMWQMTAAHKTLPLPTYVRVTRLDDGRSIVVKVNDRGPFHEGRVIDLSYAAALKLGVVKSGVADVEVVALEPQSGAGRDTAKTVSAGSSYYVQAGAYGVASNALAHRDTLRRAGFENAVVQTNSPGTLHLVRTGPFATRAEAEGQLAILERQGDGTATIVVAR